MEKAHAKLSSVADTEPALRDNAALRQKSLVPMVIQNCIPADDV